MPLQHVDMPETQIREGLAIGGLATANKNSLKALRLAVKAADAGAE